ncbi:AAA family ATPase [Sulfuricella sp.]|uniref:AAA family ATPase n=1 Tax=Sulfuricella sp. TaxID=2099377 RepID=UPI002BB72A2E|nr:AAA family ATPase [Sulfuricella sp.]HUX62231.1 AAA family ATPase [Sulfuricella sp.]
MIVAVLNTKGGVGKTTMSLNLAAARALDGRDVLAVDGDRQGSLIAALANREDGPAIAAAHYSEGQILRQQVTMARERYSDIIIDAGGRDNTALRAALMLADLVLIPFQPRSFDVWALDDMAALLAEARAARDIRAVAFLAMADSRGHDNDDAAGATPEGIEYLAAPVGRRKAIADAAGRGRGILEEASRDPKATAEIRRLVAAIFQ